MRATLDASDCLRSLEHARNAIHASAQQAVRDAGVAAYSSARTTTLFRDRTGELRGSLDLLDRGAFKMRLTTRAPHALFIEGGTRPHIIEARNAQFLRFEVGGVVHFRRRVKHPGTQPRPFMANARMAGGQALKVSIADRLAQRFPV